MLANFPIKYLDNEKMRPMYFSHKKIEGTTTLYGFGVNYVGKRTIDEKQQLDESLETLKM